MFPSLTPIIGTGDHGPYPVVEREASASRGLSMKKLRGLVVPHVIVVVDDGCHGRMEYREQAERCTDAIGAVPEGRRREKMRGEQSDIVGVPKRGQ